jgi:succinate dehydrogenase/fumarate reductase cytochrome b subunit
MDWVMQIRSVIAERCQTVKVFRPRAMISMAESFYLIATRVVMFHFSNGVRLLLNTVLESWLRFLSLIAHSP